MFHRPAFFAPVVRACAPLLMLALGVSLPGPARSASTVTPTATADSFVGRPIYSEPATGVQLPPNCQVDPSWRSAIPNTDTELWIAVCSNAARVWLVRRQVLEVVNARLARLRFTVLDEHIYPEETAGDTLSLQCSGPRDEPGYVVRGARWRTEGKELRLKSAHAVLRVDARSQTLVDAEPGAVDCSRFPEREAMMKRLQQSRN